MNLDVFREVTFVTECLDAMDTFEWLFSGVFPDMPLQLGSSGAFILARLAFVWLLLGVLSPDMHLQLSLLGAREVTERTSMRFILGVHHFVLLQGEGQSAGVAALVTLIRSFSSVCSYVLSQTVNNSGRIITMVAFV